MSGSKQPEAAASVSNHESVAAAAAISNPKLVAAINPEDKSLAVLVICIGCEFEKQFIYTLTVGDLSPTATVHELWKRVISANDGKRAEDLSYVLNFHVCTDKSLNIHFAQPPSQSEQISEWLSKHPPMKRVLSVDATLTQAGITHDCKIVTLCGELTFAGDLEPWVGVVVDAIRLGSANTADQIVAHFLKYNQPTDAECVRAMLEWLKNTGIIGGVGYPIRLSPKFAEHVKKSDVELAAFNDVLWQHWPGREVHEAKPSVNAQKDTI